MRISSYGMGFALAISLLSFKMALGQTPQTPKVPNTIEECEDRGEAHLCSTWQWNGKEYVGGWTNGSTGRMTIRFEEARKGQSGLRVTVTRHDKTGSSAGLYAVYTGVLRDGKLEHGKAIWTHQGMQLAGTWSGDFQDTATAEQQHVPSSAAAQ